MNIIVNIIIGVIIYNIIRLIYYEVKFKRDSKYPCFVVISPDYFISVPMYYEEAKKYSDKIGGVIKVDRKVFNKKRYEKQNVREDT